jgi:hypothetical protein
MSGIKIYKGSQYSSIKKSRRYSNTIHSPGVYKKGNEKSVVFDLDETIGSFGELYILWQGVYASFQNTNENHNMDIIFKKLLDLYPEFLRHGILNILEYLYTKKVSGECSKVFLYTNNQCYGLNNSKWLSFIIGYIHSKICSQKKVLFDKIICAFKINNQIIEPLRTTHIKTYSDFIRCSLLPKYAEICFIDNTYYNKMLNDRVYYIQPRSYHHMLSKKEIIDRFTNQFIYPSLDYAFVVDWFSKKYIDSQNPVNLSLDIIVSQKIMYHLKEFFLLSTRVKKTKKILIRFGRFTRKTRT